MDTLAAGRSSAAFSQTAAKPAATSAAGLPAPRDLAHQAADAGLTMDVLIPAPWRQLPLFGVGDAVIVKGSTEELNGRMTGRFTFGDGTQGCYVELDTGHVLTVPLADVRPQP